MLTIQLNINEMEMLTSWYKKEEKILKLILKKLKAKLEMQGVSIHFWESLNSFSIKLLLKYQMLT